ncbi:MAG TPA: 4Fe-4S binding protein [Firmicutes bacterium]|nr:4Fe-4S binding protein [Bacillota bacterium]
MTRSASPIRRAKTTPPGLATGPGGVAHIDPEKCTSCGACVDECPFEAIHLED